jgi:hypothetical protein
VWQCGPWPVATHCLPTGWPPEPEQWSDAQTAAVEVASEILKRLTAGQYGLCSLKIRPCRTRCADEYRLRDSLVGVGGAPWSPALIDGRMYNIACGCAGQCGCSPLCEIVLNPYATTILEVKVDGAVLPANAYRVDDNRRLVRVDGECWPDCQELGLPDTEPGTFSVTYQTGVPVPAGGRLAVALLAVQLWKACSGSTCNLPERVTQVVREGVTYTLLDNLDVFERGRTGLSQVDMWLASVNPYGVRAPMAVYSPDTVRSRSTSWPDANLPTPGVVQRQSYTHVQSVVASTWTIVHNLGFYPAGVRIEDGNGEDTTGEISYLDVNTVRIIFNQPLSGVAYLS